MVRFGILNFDALNLSLERYCKISKYFFISKTYDIKSVCFESIPKQLAKENKKFQYSVVKKGGRSSQYIGSIQWLEDAGIVRRCYNIQTTELPLEGNSIKDCFKVYTTDIGLLVAMLDYGTQADILKGNLLGYKGAIFENLMG